MALFLVLDLRISELHVGFQATSTGEFGEDDDQKNLSQVENIEQA